MTERLEAARAALGNRQAWLVSIDNSRAQLNRSGWKSTVAGC